MARSLCPFPPLLLCALEVAHHNPKSLGFTEQPIPPNGLVGLFRAVLFEQYWPMALKGMLAPLSNEPTDLC